MFHRWTKPAVAAGMLTLLGLTAAPASAAITEGPCDGSVTIKGTTYTPANDTEANPVIVPDEPGLVFTWHGDTGGAVIKNHSGQIGVSIGPGVVPVADWSNPNEGGDTSADGSYNLDTAWEKIGFHLVGIYRVEGNHDGEGGSCEGFAYVKIEGNPLTTPVGAGALALTVAAGAGVLFAGKAKRAKPGTSLKPRH
jgi:hypothetical protein